MSTLDQPFTSAPQCLRMLTFLPMDEIAYIEENMGKADYMPNTAQQRLAEEVTRVSPSRAISP